MLYALCPMLLLLIMGVGCSKPSPPIAQELTAPLVWPAAPEKARIRYLYSITKPEDIGISPSFWGKVWNAIAGEKRPVQIIRPYGLYVSREEVLYVADPGAQAVHVFDLQQRRYREIKKYGKQGLISPIGVGMDGAGLLYVSDSFLKRIYVFGPQGEPVREIGKEGQLQRPTSLVIDHSRKRIYVADTAEHSILVLDLEGKLLSRLGRRGEATGEFNFPVSLAIDPKGNLYVNDSLNYRIQVFGPDGKFLRLFGKHGDAMGEFSSPKGVALDSEGHIYVADAIFDAVQIFNGVERDGEAGGVGTVGQLLLSFGEAGQGPGEFWIPTSIFIDQANRIFVSDSYNHRVQVFKYLGGN
jgi:DNA-binding beta-propeller fold protein YncE